MRVRKTNYLVFSVMLIVVLFASCVVGNAQQVFDVGESSISVGTSDPKETVIVLSDDVITVDGKEISTDVKAAVFASNDIIYYEDKDSYESGNPYGEGTTADKHSKEEADLHTVVNITKPGTYRLSGSLSHGQISIDLGEDAKRDPSAVVTLVLDGVEITNTVAPAVIFYNVYECNTAWVAYDEGETEDYTAAKDVDTSDAGANVIIADGSVNQINGSYVARIYKDNENKKKKHKYDGAFYSKMSMNVNGEKENSGVLNIVAENEGLDTEMHLTINGGKINIFSQDDGINTNEDGVSVTTINGGSLHIVAGLGAEGDGVDSNGYLVINGGVVIATAKPQSDSGLDADLGSFINGGYVVATGSTMDWAESDSDQVTMNLQFASMQDNTEAIIITDTKGNVVFAYDPDKDETTGTNNRGYRGAVVSSPDFAVGSTYYVYIGGEVDGEDVDGLYDISTVKGFTGGIRQIYTGTDVRGFRGMGMRPGMQPGGFDPFGGRNFNQGVSTQIDSEMANIVFNLIKERIVDKEITLDEIMACTTVQEFIELMGIDVHGALIPDGQRPDMPEGEIPEFPEGGMFTPDGNSNNIQTAGDANFEFYMNDKVNAFSGVADEV